MAKSHRPKSRRPKSRRSKAHRSKARRTKSSGKRRTFRKNCMKKCRRTCKQRGGGDNAGAPPAKKVATDTHRTAAAGVDPAGKPGVVAHTGTGAVGKPDTLPLAKDGAGPLPLAKDGAGRV